MMHYTEAVTQAADLLEPSEWQENPEYLRGMCELIARGYGLRDVETTARAEMVRHDIAAVLGVDA